MKNCQLHIVSSNKLKLIPGKCGVDSRDPEIPLLYRGWQVSHCATIILLSQSTVCRESSSASTSLDIVEQRKSTKPGNSSTQTLTL